MDIVTIAVKVPYHSELLLTALAAGKHVYCEWPLGRNLAEAKELAAAADKAGVHVVIGLQTRRSPAALKGRTLVSIHGGHAIDLAIALLGPLEELNALGTTQHSKVSIRDTGGQEQRTIPDHFLLQGHLQSGAPLSVEVAGAAWRKRPFSGWK